MDSDRYYSAACGVECVCLRVCGVVCVLGYQKRT